jgi:RNA-directed DNA polymerase
MKRLDGLWPKVTSFENLLLAFRKARRGKRRKTDVARFGLNLEIELLRLQRELLWGDYQPGGYRLFKIYERKPRIISAALFRDRVVHHAVMNLIEPLLDRAFIHDSYACRKGKGVHAAIDRYQGWAHRHTYALKMDIVQYFPSIDHDILKAKLRRRIKDRSVLQLLDLIIDSSPPVEGELRYFSGDDLLTPLEHRIGIPIGNLTSQFFANLYLDEFDHFIKERLRVKPYLRYVDDMVVLGDDKETLAAWREGVRERLAEDRLRLHPRKAHVTRTHDGLNLLGYLVYPGRRRLRDDNGYRFARKLRYFARAFAEGELGWDDINPSVQSWIGHARHADTHGLRRAIFSEVKFSRGAGLRKAGV